MNHSQTRHTGGFTLVELLVVISIVSLLVALLLPALSKARDTAEAVLCASTMRQQSMAMFTYAHDFDGKLPYYMEGWDQYHLEGRMIEYQLFPSGPRDDFVWYSPMLECPSGSPELTWTSSIYPQRVVAFRNGQRGAVYTNFGGDPRRTRNYLPRKYRVFTHYNWNGRHANNDSYADFPFVNWKKDSDGNRVPVPNRRLDDGNQPANTWMAGDGASTATLGMSNIAWRHGVAANFSYFDGHVELLTPSEVDGGSHSGKTIVADERLDFIR